MATINKAVQFENPHVAKLFPEVSNAEAVDTINHDLRQKITNGRLLVYSKLKKDHGLAIDNAFKKSTPNAFDLVDGFANWEIARNKAYKEKRIDATFQSALPPVKFVFTADQHTQINQIDALQQLLNNNPGKSIAEIIKNTLAHTTTVDPKRIATAITGLDAMITTNSEPLIHKMRGVIKSNIIAEQTQLQQLQVLKEAHAVASATSLSTMIYDPIAKQIETSIQKTEQLINQLKQNQEQLNHFVMHQKPVVIEAKTDAILLEEKSQNQPVPERPRPR